MHRITKAANDNIYELHGKENQQQEQIFQTFVVSVDKTIYDRVKEIQNKYRF